jgi:hypothetical protein
VRDPRRSAPTTIARLFLAAAGAIVASCAYTAPTDICATSVSSLTWTIWIYTPTVNYAELAAGEELRLGLYSWEPRCSDPSYSEVWSQSNGGVARLTPASDGKGATLRGLQPGTTVVTAVLVGTDGARAQATQTFRVVP